MLIDVLWEDGSFEEGVDPAQICEGASAGGAQEFFPAMYVYVSHSAGKQVLAPRDQKLVTLAKSNHFCVVRAANNAQKFALVDIYLFNRQAYVESGCTWRCASANQPEPLPCQTSSRRPSPSWCSRSA